MATRKFKCPRCGYRFLADPEQIYEKGQVAISRGPAGRTDLAGDRTIELTCPNCASEFEVKIVA